MPWHPHVAGSLFKNLLHIVQTVSGHNETKLNLHNRIVIQFLPDAWRYIFPNFLVSIYGRKLPNFYCELLPFKQLKLNKNSDRSSLE